jgi:hypothetical protein
MRTRYANDPHATLSGAKKKTNMLCSPKAKNNALVLQAKRVAEKVRTRSKEISFLVFQPGSCKQIGIGRNTVSAASHPPPK